MNKLFCIKPTIFDKYDIVAGVTGKNISEDFPKGLSFSNADIYSDGEVAESKIKLADYIHISPDRMKYQKQTHSDIISEITYTSGYDISDGMFTDKSGIILNIKIADCTAILIFDPVKKVIMGLHSGWRGTKLNIAHKGISILINNYGSNPRDILAYLSPAACGSCYEVGKDFATYFPRSVIPLRSGKYLFDNRQEILLQLLDCGLQKSNVETAKECTIEDSRLHSYRRDGNTSGRMSAFIGITPF